MENTTDIDVDSFDMIDRTVEEEEEQKIRDMDERSSEEGIKRYFEMDVKPGHFSYDVLQHKFGIDDLDLSIINKQVGGFANFNNDSLPRVIEGNEELKEYVLQYAFKDSSMNVDSSLLRPLFERLEFFVRESDGRLQAVIKNSTTKNKNFFIMDSNGNFEYFTKNGRLEYKKDIPQRYTMLPDYLDGYGIDKRIISDIKANNVYNKGKEVLKITDATEKVEMARGLIDEIGESSKVDSDDTPKTS